MTEVLTKLPSALSKFQASHHAAGRDGKGNYGTYTTLAGALAAIQPACAFGLCHTQTIQPISDDLMVLRTTLMHESGECVTSDLPLPIRQEGVRGNAMQALGSALTYARRYGLLAIYGLAGDDDDGETAAPSPAKKAVAVSAKNAKPAAATSQKPAEPKQASSDIIATELPLDDAERQEILQMLKTMMQTDRPTFNAFVGDYRDAFNPPEGVKLSDHIQERQHGDFAQQFFAKLLPLS
jgi:hypothetical protein